MTADELPMLIKRCLTHQVKIYPYQLYGVLTRYETHKIPDVTLAKMRKEEVEKYVDALYLSSKEMAGDWTKGHELLEELGFTKKSKREGHREFVTYIWDKEVKETL